MTEIFNYIEFCFNRLFLHYEKKEFKIIDSVLSEVVDKSLYDINYKFSEKRISFSRKELGYLLQTDPTLEALFLYRLEREIFLRDNTNSLLPYLASIMRRRTGSEIYYSTNIGPGFNIQHGFGIVIGPRYEIGENFTIHQGVTLGQKSLNSPNEKIVIGNNVTIFAGAIVLGDIKIGDNAIIAANAVQLNNVEPNSVYGGVPAKRIK